MSNDDDSFWDTVSSYFGYSDDSYPYGGYINSEIVDKFEIKKIVDSFDSELSEVGEYYEFLINASAAFVVGGEAGLRVRLEKVTGSTFDLTWEIQGGVSFEIQPGAKTTLADAGAEIKALLSLAPSITISLQNKDETIQAIAILYRLIMAAVAPLAGVIGTVVQQAILVPPWDDIAWIKRRISKVRYAMLQSLS